MSNQVLFLTLRTFSATGGIEKVCKLMGKALSDIGCESNSGAVKLYSMYDQQQELDVKYFPAAGFKGFGERKVRFVSAAVREGCRSDVVILSHINLLLIGVLIKLLSPKTKLLLLAHGIEVWSPLPALRRSCLHRCDLILAVSTFTRDKMQHLFAIPDSRIAVLNNCLDPFLGSPEAQGKDEALMAKIGFKPNDFILLTLTRLSSKERYKGYDSVLRSVSVLKQQYPNIQYLIVGKFDPLEVQRVGKIIQELGLESHVYLAGFVPDEELAKYFCLADLYIMPSKKEGFGIVFIEAMYYGLPIIAGNCDGSADALLQGKMGMLVDPDSMSEINGAIEKVMNDKERYEPDHAVLMEHFDFNAYKKKVRKIISGL